MISVEKQKRWEGSSADGMRKKNVVQALLRLEVTTCNRCIGYISSKNVVCVVTFLVSQKRKAFQDIAQELCRVQGVVVVLVIDGARRHFVPRRIHGIAAHRLEHIVECAGGRRNVDLAKRGRRVGM